MDKLRYIGKPEIRVDGREKMSGAAIYADDIDFGPDLLFAEIVESEYAHAIINSIDTSEAEKLPEVVKVITGKDFPFKFGLYMKDRFIFAQDRVRFIGEQVAVVVARCPKVAKRAVKLVKVNYTPLPALTNQMDALKEDAPLLHEGLENYNHVPWL